MPNRYAPVTMLLMSFVLGLCLVGCSEGNAPSMDRIKEGMSQSKIQQMFGKPDRTDTYNSEATGTFNDSETASGTIWVYKKKRGELWVYFDDSGKVYNAAER